MTNRSEIFGITWSRIEKRLSLVTMQFGDKSIKPQLNQQLNFDLSNLVKTLFDQTMCYFLFYFLTSLIFTCTRLDFKCIWNLFSPFLQQYRLAHNEP